MNKIKRFFKKTKNSTWLFFNALVVFIAGLVTNYSDTFIIFIILCVGSMIVGELEKINDDK